MACHVSLSVQDKSIPLVIVNEEEDRSLRDPYFTTLLQGLGLFPADAAPTCVFCRIPQFLTPAQLLRKAQQLGDIDLSEWVLWLQAKNCVTLAIGWLKLFNTDRVRMVFEGL